ncbi:MAG: Ferredoxin, 2Fe-2S [Cyanobacteriota bacterium]|jgi:(2Fe-2S) ferredoxin
MHEYSSPKPFVNNKPYITRGLSPLPTHKSARTAIVRVSLAFFSRFPLCLKLFPSILITCQELIPNLVPPMDSSGQPPRRWLVQVCQHRTCLRHQSSEVLAAFQAYQSPQILVAASGCMGQCSSGPTVHILPDDTWYCRLRPEDVATIVAQHCGQGQPVVAHLHPRFHPPNES